VNNESENFNTDELFNCIFDFILVGMETTSTTLKWALLFLTLHQDVQDRCRNEVYEVVGSAKVTVANRPSMPFLQATIAEIQRLSSVSTFVPHVTTAPTKVGEFNFPKNSFFNVNLRFIMNDPAHFDKPEQFNPDRFISEDGRYIKNERVIPFGIGRRHCMAEQLARNEIFIFLADLLQQLRFLPPRDHPAPKTTNYIINLTRIPKDFNLRVEKLDEGSMEKKMSCYWKEPLCSQQCRTEGRN